VLGVIKGRQVDVSWTYETSSPAPADIAYQLLPR
jgi:hypothetical protein